MRRKIAAALLALGMALAAQEQPLSLEEALYYIAGLSQVEIAQEIITLDTIEGATPTIGWGDIAVVYLGDGIFSLAIPDMSIKIATLSYAIHFPPQTFELQIEQPPPFLEYIAIGASCLAAGLLVGLLF